MLIKIILHCTYNRPYLVWMYVYTDNYLPPSRFQSPFCLLTNCFLLFGCNIPDTIEYWLIFKDPM